MSLHRRFSRVAVPAVALLVVTSALAVAPAAVAAAEETEPNDSRATGQSIPTGEKVTGDISGSDAGDWFNFTVERGETVNVTGIIGAGSGADGNMLVRVIGPNGGVYDQIRTGKEDTPQAFVLGMTARTSGTYHVEVLPEFGGFSADYNFTVDTYRTDAFEPNEDRGNATSIRLNDEVSGVLSVGDEDRFNFTAERGETINVTGTVTKRAGSFLEGGNTVVQLVGPNGRVYGQRRTDAGKTPRAFALGTTAPTSGTYHVDVLTEFGGFSAGYNFTVDTYRTDAFEPNEDRGNASRLFENPFVPDRAVLSIGDDDYFNFTAERGETINVTGTVTKRAGSFLESKNTVVQLVAPNGSTLDKVRIREEEAPRAFVLGTTAPASGTYNIDVLTEFGGFSAGYNFTVDVPGETLGLPNDPFERSNPPVGNQDRANATDLGPGAYRDLAIVDDDRDVFAVDLDAGERLIAEAGFTHAENDLALALRDSAGTTLTSADSATDDERLSFTATEAGTHYLRVTGEAGAQARYDLDVTVLRQLDVTVGPGADSLDPGATATYEVALTEPSAGLAGVNLSLATTNATVLRISDVTLAAGASGSASVAADGSSATVTAADLATVNGTVPVATVTVAAEAAGEARLGAGAAVTAPGGLAYPLGTVQNTTVSVGTAPAAPDLTGDGNPATDPDDDGVYEDITGDGSFDIFDVQAFLDRFNSAPVQNNSALFNFDDSGGVNIFDVQALLDEV